VARALIVGCGCRGRELGAELLDRGWQVRGTSRQEHGLWEIEAASLEPAAADPDRPGTVLELCGDVAVLIWLLGSARGDPEAVRAVNGPRLERLVEKLVDTPVRGILYEAVGAVAPEILAGGREIVERAGHIWRIPVATLEEDRGTPGWAGRAAQAVSRLLAL
jgi:nucleoside-diphosphate-sugar epimerase